MWPESELTARSGFRTRIRHTPTVNHRGQWSLSSVNYCDQLAKSCFAEPLFNRTPLNTILKSPIFTQEILSKISPYENWYPQLQQLNKYKIVEL